MPRALRIRQPGSFVGRGEGRRAGRKQLWSKNCSRPGASGEEFSPWALDPPLDKASLFQREAPTYLQPARRAP